MIPLELNRKFDAAGWQLIDVLPPGLPVYGNVSKRVMDQVQIVEAESMAEVIKEVNTPRGRRWKDAR